MPLFESVLIANRGEIAVRIARTLRALGIRSVLACHELDAEGPAALAVDQVVRLGKDDPIAAYLDASEIIRLAADAGAQAIHPGYGFLAEDANFAEAVSAAGLRFIGPPPEAMRLMGDKIRSREFASERGLHVSASVVEADAQASFADRAADLGTPLLIKASAGGGGKGMQIVRSLGALGSAIERCRAEGERFFGDGRLYAERYIEKPRHIEVQILADAHGNCLHLLDRECSIQRRFQKLVEEAPAPALPDQTRSAMQREAVELASAVGYEGAGTVEFVVDPSGAFFFLEMNTRLQVEHPVTEYVTGIDLVEQQLRVGAGEALAFSQSDIRAKGHSVEVRLCAEDPERNFAPATGTLHMLEVPDRPWLRFDSGVSQGSSVSASFDPMLAKLITHGANRAEAVARMQEALEEMLLLGVVTNQDLLARVMAHDAFRSGALHTGFLQEHAATLGGDVSDACLAAVVSAAALSHRPLIDAAEAVPELHATMGGWRN